MSVRPWCGHPGFPLREHVFLSGPWQRETPNRQKQSGVAEVVIMLSIRAVIGHGMCQFWALISLAALGAFFHLANEHSGLTATSRGGPAEVRKEAADTPVFHLTNSSKGLWALPLRGQWVHMGPNRTFDAPLMWGLENETQFAAYVKVCRKDRKKYNTEYCGYAHPAQNGRNFVDEWKWQSPDLPPFDSNSTCQQLGDRTVLLIGDSTVMQTAVTLKSALLSGGCSPLIQYQIADTLIFKNLGVMNRGMYWMRAVRRLQPDIVILGTGPHIKYNFVYIQVLDQVIADIQKWQLKEGQNHDKSISFVLKTQQPAGCSKTILHPTDPLRAGAEFNFSQTPNYKKYWQDNYYDRDVYAMNRWIKEVNSSYIFDLRMLWSRSDAHPGSGQAGAIDCLHLLSPGPLDVVASLFQRLLVQIDTNGS